MLTGLVIISMQMEHMISSFSLWVVVAEAMAFPLVTVSLVFCVSSLESSEEKKQIWESTFNTMCGGRWLTNRAIYIKTHTVGHNFSQSPQLLFRAVCGGVMWLQRREHPITGERLLGPSAQSKKQNGFFSEIAAKWESSGRVSFPLQWALKLFCTLLFLCRGK